MDLNFESLTNAHIIADDVLIVGSDLGPLDEHDHDRCLLQVLNRCREVSLKLNAAKCIFKVKQEVFYTHLVHTNGLSPDPQKVQVISNMLVPSNKTELQSYIGMCNFLSSYVPHLTDKLFVLQLMVVILSGQQIIPRPLNAVKVPSCCVQHSCTSMMLNPVQYKLMPATLVLVLC